MYCKEHLVTDISDCSLSPRVCTCSECSDELKVKSLHVQSWRFAILNRIQFTIRSVIRIYYVFHKNVNKSRSLICLTAGRILSLQLFCSRCVQDRYRKVTGDFRNRHIEIFSLKNVMKCGVSDFKCVLWLFKEAFVLTYNCRPIIKQELFI